ncbi:MAG: flippase-like domain-containing protein [Haliscomenobacter sp.]|nr:flippase-like domain-containing protein [Haliscomenobacter sp.]
MAPFVCVPAEGLNQKEFSWWKCIELIFIWEFSSAVSPTSLGGSAVAFFVLAQEKLSAARTATIVMYTIILDSLFLLTTVPILYFIFGSSVMRPGVVSFADTGVWGVYFLVTYFLMLSYSSLIYYGVFINPHQLERLMGWLTNNRFLRRYYEKARAFGKDMETASLGLKKEPLIFHLKAIVATIAAWTLRFLIISALIIAFLPNLPLDFSTQFQLYARLEVMFFVIAFSPTPGGAGLIDLLFGGFLTDYVSNPTQSAMISTLWRLMSYYVYLFAGALIVPNWIRQRINERRERQMEAQQKEEGEERPHA